MARKTTKLMHAMVTRHTDAMKHYTSVLAAKDRGDEAPIFRERGRDFYEGIAMGQSLMLETALLEANCYHGFQYVDGNKKPVREGDEGFAEWRRIYLTK